jgi:hypothetical protein
MNYPWKDNLITSILLSRKTFLVRSTNCEDRKISDSVALNKKEREHEPRRKGNINQEVWMASRCWKRK